MRVNLGIGFGGIVHNEGTRPEKTRKDGKKTFDLKDSEEDSKTAAMHFRTG